MEAKVRPSSFDGFEFAESRSPSLVLLELQVQARGSIHKFLIKKTQWLHSLLFQKYLISHTHTQTHTYTQTPASGC